MHVLRYLIVAVLLGLLTIPQADARGGEAVVVGVSAAVT